ncbi:MAG: hypothetical protein ACP5G1_01365 [Nanopusillaceae archaeon]
MGSRYRIGYYYERKVKEMLENAGFDAWRTPGSHSPIDIIAVNKKGHVRLIQVKKSKRKLKLDDLDILELKELYEFAKKYKDVQNVDIEVWIFNSDGLKIYNKMDILNSKKINSLLS